MLANAGVHLIRRSPQLVHRTQMTSMWLRQAHDPELAAGNLEHLSALHEADELVFGSARSVRYIHVTGAVLGAPLLANGAESTTRLHICVPRFEGDV